MSGAWQFIRGQRQTKGFLKQLSARKDGELLSMNRNQLRIMTGLQMGHCHLKGHLFKLGLVDNHEFHRPSRHLKWPHTFCVTMRFQSHYDSAT
jgi:hypothetical protein